MKHAHAEAFCHMKYFGISNRKSVSLTIWNSRDGVTPFIMVVKEIGMELQHVNWQGDVYDPLYKPKKGDLIWRDVTDEEVIQFASKQFEEIVEDSKRLEGLTHEEVIAKYSWDLRTHFQSIISEGKDFWIDMRKKNVQPGSPHLELIKEDWK